MTTKRVVTLEDIESRREKKLYGPRGGTTRYYTDREMSELMRPGIQKAPKIGKRPVGNNGGTLNQNIISRSPGSSTNRTLDFLKAVYSNRTGQE